MKNRNLYTYLVLVLLVISVGGNIYSYRLNKKREEKKAVAALEAEQKAAAALQKCAPPQLGVEHSQPDPVGVLPIHETVAVQPGAELDASDIKINVRQPSAVLDVMVVGGNVPVQKTPI